MKLAIHPSSVALQSVSAFLGGAFVMALQGPVQSPGHQDAQAIPTCAKTIEDVTTGICVSADSTPTLGSLYPMSPDLNVDLAGNVGIGTTMPTAKMDVVGGANFSGPVGIGRTEPQYDLHVERQDSSPPVELFLASGNATPYRSTANLTTNGGGFDGSAILTLTGSGCIGNSGLILVGPYLPSVFVNYHWDDALFNIQYGNDFLFSGTYDAPTTTGTGAQVTVGTYGVDARDGHYSGYLMIASTTLRVCGDASQPLDASGLLKSGCHVDGTVTPPAVSRTFNILPLGYPESGAYQTEVARVSTGSYEVSFLNVNPSGVADHGPIDLGSRFFQATLGSATNATVPPGFIQVHPGTNSVVVETFDVTGAPADNQFYLAVY